MNILIIVGGTSNPSNSEMLADEFAKGAEEVGAYVGKALLRDLTIDHFRIECYDPAYPEEKDFAELRAKIKAADGLVFASPIWNFGVPGNLKNFIDRCGSFALDHERRMKATWNDKPFFLIFTGGSPMPAWTGLLRKTTSGIKVGLQYFGGAHAGTYFEPKCTPGKGRFGLIVDKRPESLAAVRAKGKAFAALVRHHAESGTLPVMMRLKRKFYALGQKIQRKLF
jgi:multimeric flavodoxin WrbA